MTEENEKAYGFEQAFDAARAEGLKEGEAVGYAKGRTDAASIMGNEEALGRMEAAAELAGDPGITVDRAVSLLGKMPKGKADSFAEMMRGKSPEVGANQDPSSSTDLDREKRAQQLRATAAAVSKVRR